MEFHLVESVDGIEADAIVVPVPEDASTCDARFAAVAKPLFASGDLPLKPLETLLIPATPKILFIGISKTLDVEAWRRTAATAIRRAKRVRKLAFAGGETRAIVEGALVGGFSVEAYKSTNNRPSVR